MRSQRSFTLIELLIVIGILAILVAAVVIALNPAQLLAQARDGKRQQDLLALNQALNTVSALDQTISFGSSSIVYTSLPDSTTTCANWHLPTLPTGWQYHCSPTTTLQNTNGTGWIPVNFQSNGIVTLSALPTDPINTSSTGLYYTYVSGGSYELTAAFESSKYKLGGDKDIASTDGGLYPDLYEVGSNLSLQPLDYGDPSLVGYWPLNEGTGTVAYDRSGKGHNGTLMNSPTWISGAHTSLQLNGINYSPYTNSYVSLSNVQMPITSFSVSLWFYINHDAVSRGASNIILKEANGTSLYQHNANNYLYFGSGARYIFWVPTNGAWHSLICSVTNTGSPTLDWQGQCYGDGVLKSINQGGYFASSSLTVFGLDGTSGSATSIDGALRDVRVYNRALSASEIQALYSATK